jgi:cytochrome P450
LDIDEMTDDFVTFFGAGQETTANTLAFCFLELGKNPSLVEKAREEIDRVLGQRNEVTFQDVNELKYCAAVFKEALRLYPPISDLSRVTQDKIEIDGRVIPEQTFLVVFICNYLKPLYIRFISHIFPTS